MIVPKGITKLEGAAFLRQSLESLTVEVSKGPVGIIYRNDSPSVVVMHIAEWKTIQEMLDIQQASK